MFFDPMYFIFALPALILGLYAQMKVKSTFSKYSKIAARSGMTGADAARRILDSNGLYNVTIERVGGFLSDHYDPSKKVLRLSPDVYNTNSIAAVGVAAHESGHALQDQAGYMPLNFRSAMVPAVQFGSWLGPVIFMIGFFMSGGRSGSFGTQIAWIGVGLFAMVALFAIVTLPVELNASSRAKESLVNLGIISQDDRSGVSSVLNAAALTYIAAAVQAISTLLYYVFLLTGSRRRD
ncbi:MAG: zinc metallopeptidase [Chloroflexota bacterium]